MPTAFKPADILIPKNTDMKKWSVIACDQYTSEPEYWNKLYELIGDSKSALNLVLPEVYLESPDIDKRIEEIHKTMNEYLESDVFEELKDSMIYVERTQSNGKIRRGVIGMIDLEEYDYSKNSQSEIRATEATVIERIPPRIRVREGASLELPHIMILIDDENKSIVENLSYLKKNMRLIYDFDLYLCCCYEPLRRGRRRGGHQGMKHFNRTITVLVFIFLYIPMIVLAVASFNTGTDIASFKGFTFRQYANLFRDGTLLTLLRNSVIIALLATLISTVVGTMAAVGIHSMKGKLRSAVMTMTNIPMTNPDIVTGVALALLFAFAGTILKTNSVLGFWTLLIAHITFNLPYVILNVMPKLQQMDKDLVEAALDLGCTPFQSFTKVVIHEIMPGIISGALMAFTMSLDDFVISYFVTGSSFITLPVEIYNYTKKPIQPKIYALFTLMFIVILVLMVVMNLLQAKSEKNRQQPRRARV